MNKTREIRELLRRIAGTDKQVQTFFNAQVTEVGDDFCTVKYQELVLEDVRLGAVVDGGQNKLIVKPAIGSQVLIADLSEGTMRDLAVIAWSDVESIIINGGSLGGLVNISALTDKLNQLVQVFNTHTHTVSTTGTAAAQTGTAAPITSLASQFNASDYEDDKIKH